MKFIQLRTMAWYGDKDVRLPVPDNWEVNLIECEDLPVLTDDDISKTFAAPIGTPTLSELAQGFDTQATQPKGKQSAAIIVDDLNRPTPAYRLMPFILRELKRGGIEAEDVAIVTGAGTHKHMTRIDLVKKLGEEVVRTVQTFSHDIDRGLVHVGESSKGAPIDINQAVMECEVKIGVGGLYQLGADNFGGGAKIILPGVSGVQTIQRLHGSRPDMEEIAERIGLNFLVNVVLNGRREIIGLFVGHFVAARSEGVEFAKRAYAVDCIADMDVVIANAYPIDATLDETPKGMWPLSTVKPGGTKILITSASEGVGLHHCSPRSRTPAIKREKLEEADFILYSPVVGPREAYAIFPNCIFFNSWENLIEKVSEKHQKQAVKAAVYPYAAIQIPKKGAFG